jgi:hypothetical protein
MKIILFFIVIFFNYMFNVYSQNDSEFVSINKISNNSINEFNISDVKYKDDDENLEINVFQLKLYIPVKTELKLNVLDTANNQIREIINEKTYDKGVYKIKWKMNNIFKGKYIIEMVTDQFIYTKDFFIVSKTSKHN